MNQFEPRIKEMTTNLITLYQSASAEDRVLGEAWYPTNHKLVVEWSAHYGYSISTVACVIAVLSPQVQWERNLVVAADLLAGRSPSIGGVIHSNIVKAQAIMRDRATNTLDYFPQGPKVASFACNLAGDYDVVTVDTHGLQAALNNVQANVRLNWNRYTTFAYVYSHAAEKVKVQPAIFQAVTWHTWKRLYPRTYKLVQRRQWHVMGEY
jgi:hypothetical protein